MGRPQPSSNVERELHQEWRARIYFKIPNDDCVYTAYAYAEKNIDLAINTAQIIAKLKANNRTVTRIITDYETHDIVSYSPEQFEEEYAWVPAQ